VDARCTSSPTGARQKDAGAGPTSSSCCGCPAEKNPALGVTSLLLFRDGTFIQLLEGGRDEVEALYDTIRADVRHKDVTTIWRFASDSTWSTDWSMGFRDLEDDPVSVPGLTDLLRGPVNASALGHEVVQELWSVLRQPSSALLLRVPVQPVSATQRCQWPHW
jgi:hypothetical protein